ncbi:2Fe-2S iron-sulfur cluster-binding protein [Streptomyces sp. NPDC093085]|uniref:2Fe-2S iron-sulfur cluster-binding protein n=1 Tax=Streptomyces sp. NPDC093085 TaxID=3155068 RepID=UPI00341A8E16
MSCGNNPEPGVIPLPFSLLTTAEQVEAVVGHPASMVMLKQVAALDEGCRTVLARSPVAALGYRDAGGTAATTFIGGAPGFARVHSPTRFSFTPPGPVDPYGPVSLFFLLPGVGEILRVNGTVTGRAAGRGTGRVTGRAAGRGTGQVTERAAGRKGAQVTVAVQEAYVHCAQAVLRSRLWQPQGARTAPTTAPIAAPATAPVTAPTTAPADPEGSREGPLHDPGVAAFLAASPFLALSTWDTGGGADTSPRGDRGTVARVLDGRTLVLPDRRGNKRADTLHNLLQDDRISLAALVPGRSETLLIRGRAAITDDAALLATMALRGMPPHLALVIDVEHAEVTGNDAVAGAGLWTPDTHLDRATAPDMMALGSAHLATGMATAKGGGPAFLLKAVTAIPGLHRLMRRMIDVSYRSGLRKEGYEEPGYEEQGYEKPGYEESYADGATAPYNGGVNGPAPVPGSPRTTPAASSPSPSPLRHVRIAELRRETPTTLTLVLEDTDESRHGSRHGSKHERRHGKSGRPRKPRKPRKRGRPFDFRPGQFFTLVADIDGRPVRRAYSASSAPGSERLEITVKHIEGGLFSTHVHRALRTGDRLAVRGPSGSFHAEPEPPGETVLLAGGSGVTPLMSMVRTRLADRTARDRVTLLHSSRSEEETIFGEELARLALAHPDRLSVTQVLTSRDGRLDAEGIRRWVTGRAPAPDAHYYLCGPEPLMDAAGTALAGLGIPDERVHRERFAGGPRSRTRSLPAEPQAMTVRENGRPAGTAMVAPGQTLLEAGLAAGLPLPYSCTVGNCGDCLVRLRAGRVAQDEPNCLTPEQRAAGSTLTCVGRPLTEVTLDITDP